MNLFILNAETGHFITWWDHSHTGWLDRTTHFYFKYFEIKNTTLGPDILQEYFSPEPHFMRHQAFPSPQNSPSTLDSFSISKQGSVLKCNTACQNISQTGMFKGASSSGDVSTYRKLEHSLLRLQKPGAERKAGRTSYKEDLASSRVVSNRRVRNTCNKQLESTCSVPLLLKRL